MSKTVLRTMDKRICKININELSEQTEVIDVIYIQKDQKVELKIGKLGLRTSQMNQTDSPSVTCTF